MNPDELDELRSLPRQESPPAWLEERIVRELKTRGLIRQAPPARRWAALSGALAASIMLFVAGMAAGDHLTRPRATAPDGPRFMLLLYEDAGYLAPEPGATAGRVTEYGDWAGELGARGLFVGGEKLKNAAEILPPGATPPSTGPGTLAGYFIIAARGMPEAMVIARDCPHLRYGGKIVVREIDPV